MWWFSLRAFGFKNLCMMWIFENPTNMRSSLCELVGWFCSLYRHSQHPFSSSAIFLNTFLALYRNTYLIKDVITFVKSEMSPSTLAFSLHYAIQRVCSGWMFLMSRGCEPPQAFQASLPFRRSSFIFPIYLYFSSSVSVTAACPLQIYGFRGGRQISL